MGRYMPGKGQGDAAENGAAHFDPASTPNPATGAPAIQAPRRDPRRGRISFVMLWLNDVSGNIATMSPTAVGAYLRILLRYFKDQAPLPDDEKFLRRITGVSKAEWLEVRDQLLDVMDLVEGFLIDQYAEKQIAAFKKKSNRNSANRQGGLRALSGGLKDADE